MKQSELIAGETYAVEIAYQTWRPAIFEEVERQKNSLGRVIDRKLRFRSVAISDEEGEELMLGRRWGVTSERNRGRAGQEAGELIRVTSGRKVINRWEPFVQGRLALRARKVATEAEGQRQTELGLKLTERLATIGVNVNTEWYDRKRHAVTIDEGAVSIDVDGLAIILDAAGVK